MSQVPIQRRRVMSGLDFLFHDDNDSNGNATMNISPSTTGSSESLLLSPFDHEHGPLNYNNFPDDYYGPPQQERKNTPSTNRYSVNNSEHMTGTAAFHGYP